MKKTKYRINIEKDELIGVSPAARLVPPHGVHPASLTRWALYGIDGVYLETVLIAGRRYTTRLCLFDFLDATNGSEQRAVTE